MVNVYLKKNEDRRIKAGHLWVFSNEIEKFPAQAENGDLAEVYNQKGEFLGTGFFNRNSLISVRILSRDRIGNLKEIFKEKLLNASALRKEMYPGRNSYRLIFSESDFFPGVIIDKYNSTFVLQIYSFGIQKNIGKLTELLKEELNAENIFTKNEPYFRRLEGLPEEDETYLGAMKRELISDGSVNIEIDFEKGQKTGFYFDQCDNRLFIEKIVKGKKVIDAFCNSGGFGLHAVKAGASEVHFVDSSASEIEKAGINFSLNNFNTRCEYTVSDIFKYFEESIAAGKKFGIVMIDPPAFAKNKKSLPAARKGYEKLNKLALQCIEKGGYLVTSSCSYHLKKEEFISIISSAAAKTGREIQLIHFNGASIDHPQLPAMEETSYLKFAVIKVN